MTYAWNKRINVANLLEEITRTLISQLHSSSTACLTALHEVIREYPVITGRQLDVLSTRCHADTFWTFIASNISVLRALLASRYVTSGVSENVNSSVAVLLDWTRLSKLEIHFIEGRWYAVDMGLTSPEMIEAFQTVWLIDQDAAVALAHEWSK